VEVVFETDDFAKKTASLRYEAAVDGQPELRLSMLRLNAVSPAEAGEGDDERRLGVLVRTLGVMWN
jgi:hypothetical protein